MFDLDSCLESTKQQMYKAMLYYYWAFTLNIVHQTVQQNVCILKYKHIQQNRIEYDSNILN